jgi:NADH:ubiquinone oxidoreductase subunit 6 (subunit J)
MRVLLLIASALFSVLAILAALGWLLNQNVAHAVGFLAAAALCYVLSTIPTSPTTTGG